MQYDMNYFHNLDHYRDQSDSVLSDGDNNLNTESY